MDDDCNDVSRLRFNPIAWEDKSTSCYSSYSYAVAYVYMGLELAYIMERIGKIWSYARWNGVETIEAGTTIKQCRDAVKGDFFNWTREPGMVNEGCPDDWALGLVFEKIAWRDRSCGTGYAVAYVYACKPFRDYSSLAYVMERRDRKWSYARWQGPKTEVGTMKACRDAIRMDVTEPEITDLTDDPIPRPLIVLGEHFRLMFQGLGMRMDEAPVETGAVSDIFEQVDEHLELIKSHVVAFGEVVSEGLGRLTLEPDAYFHQVANRLNAGTRRPSGRL